MLQILAFSLILLSDTLIVRTPFKDTIDNQVVEEVTIVGNKSRYIPGSGFYIRRQTLDRLNQPNINNILRGVPGINIRDEEGFGLRPNIGMRGTSVNRSARITLMEDGILIAPAPYADPAAYYFPTFARMQGIEVLKGSSQIKYGPYTVGGAINLISTQIPDEFKGFAQISYGSFNTNQQRFWVGDVKKNIAYVFEVNRISSTGFKQLADGANTGFDRRDILGKIRWNSDKNSQINHSVTLKFVNSSEDANETYLGLTYADYLNNPLRRYTGTQRDALNMNHQHISIQHHITPVQGLSLSTSAYYSHTFRDWARANNFGGESINNILNNPYLYQEAYNIMTGQSNGEITYQNAARNYISEGVQTHLNYMYSTKSIYHKIQFGVRYHTDQADRYATRSLFSMIDGIMIPTYVGVTGNQENQIRSATSLATFLSYDMHWNGLKISPGVRYEKIKLDFKNYGTSDHSRTGINLQSATNELTILLPGFGLNYQINEAMNIFSGIHKGFAPPGMPSLNSSLIQAQAETSVNYEIGYRYENEGLNIKLTGFFNNYTNILGSDNISGGGAGTGDMFNAGNANIHGIECSIDFDFVKTAKLSAPFEIPISLSYTYTSARFQETFINGGGDWGNGTIYAGDFIPFITPHMLTANVGYEDKKFNATITSRYTGQTRVKPGQNAILPPSENHSTDQINTLPSYLIIDLSANYMINNKLTLFSTINNLTNSKAIVANLPQGYRPNMPWSIAVGLKLNIYDR